MKPKLFLSSFCLKNFKAVQDSKTIKFTPLTAFVGNNGSGKSSIVEAMETFQSVVLNGLDEAMIPWHGFEYIWNKAKEHKTMKGKISNPMKLVIVTQWVKAWCRRRLGHIYTFDNRLFFVKQGGIRRFGGFVGIAVSNTGTI